MYHYTKYRSKSQGVLSESDAVLILCYKLEFVVLLMIASGISLIFFAKASTHLLFEQTSLQNRSENQTYTLAICLQVAHNQGRCVGVFLGMTLQECARFIESFRSLNGQKYTHTPAGYLYYNSPTNSNLYNKKA